MMKRKISLLCLLSVLVMGGSVFAGLDTTLPNTTFQAWFFDLPFDPSVPQVADIDENVYGDAMLMAPGGIWAPSYDGGKGILRAGEDGVDIHIHNTPNTAPDSYKEITIWITYNGGGHPPVVLVDMPLAPDGWPEMVSSDPVGDGYVLEQYLIVLAPNPTEETIKILPGFCALYIDDIVIETECIPEPATIGLLGMGALSLFRRRKA